jgi:hypothetical protein
MEGWGRSRAGHRGAARCAWRAERAADSHLLSGGAYLPFATTKDAATGRQPSVRDRHKDQSDYVNRVRVAAREAEAAGFLLPEDAAVIVNSAAETRLFDPTAPVAPSH